MKRHCLFIDDDIEEFDSVLQRLPKIAKLNHGLEVTYDKLDPMGKGFRNAKNDIDLAKIEADFRERIGKNKYDIIACDYDLGDDQIFGTDIIRALRQQDRKFIAIIYSADLNRIVRDIVKNHRDNNSNATLNKLRTLVTSNISRFFSKNNSLVDDLSPLLFSVTSEKHIEQVLLNYKDLKLKHGFESFVGAGFEEIIVHVRKDTEQGRKFVEEVIERGITHLIKLNE